MESTPPLYRSVGCAREKSKTSPLELVVGSFDGMVGVWPSGPPACGAAPGAGRTFCAARMRRRRRTQSVVLFLAP